MRQYLDLMRELVEKGNMKGDRTGTGTLSKFGHQMRFDLQKGFPILTTKKVHFKSVVEELLWMLSGDTNIKSLQAKGVTIWDEWADSDGNLGPVYGKQWREWNGKVVELGVDQIDDVISQIKADPNSRRLIVTAWNPEDVLCSRLPPCHVLFQFYVYDGQLSCQLYQRSCDTFLGVPFNIASYALLTHMIAQQCDLQVGEFIWTGGDVHLYNNHVEQAKLQLDRKPYALPTLHISRKPESIDDYKYEDFRLINYFNHPAINADVAV